MARGGGPIRFVGLAFLATVAVVIVALVGGYGFPVGIGALAGFVLGMVAGLVGIMWLGRGAGRSFGLGGATWSSPESGGLAPMEMAQMRERSELLQVDLGAIRAVVPVLSTVEVGGYALELVAAEVRDAGLGLVLDVRPLPGSPPSGFWADVTVRDEAGTAYRASGQGNGNVPNPMRYAIAVVPAPPSTARRLDITIERFVDPFPGAGRTAEGPWPFVIDLPPR